MRGAIFLRSRVTAQMLSLQRARAVLMCGFCCRQIAQEFTGGGVRGATRRAHIEIMRVAFHCRRLTADFLQPEVFRQPHRAAGVKSGHMLAPDQRDHLAEPRDMQVDQPLAVAVLLLCHAIKNGGRTGEIRAQPFGIAAINAGVILFRGNCKRQNFLLAQVRKTATV